MAILVRTLPVITRRADTQATSMTYAWSTMFDLTQPESAAQMVHTRPRFTKCLFSRVILMFCNCRAAPQKTCVASSDSVGNARNDQQ